MTAHLVRQWVAMRDESQNLTDIDLALASMASRIATGREE